MNSGYERLRKLIHEYGFGEYEDLIMEDTRPCIRVITKRVADEAEIPIGESKIGGRPDLPVEMDWVKAPTYYEEETRYLPFIAQLNLAEVKPYDEENLLPESGLLYFFAEPWGMILPRHIGKVIYFNGERSVLERKPFPANPLIPPEEWASRYFPCTVTFTTDLNVAYAEKLWQELLSKLDDSNLSETFWKVRALYRAFDISSPHKGASNYLVGNDSGYPDMQRDCQLETESIVYYSDATEAQINAAEARKEEWQLLFELSSDDNAGMMWSDTGVICFYIHRDDLKARNFNNICLQRFST